jgi:hypothetical protein
MKEAIIVDKNGYFKDVTLVEDDVTGVFPLYETIGEWDSPEGEPVEPPTVLIGYQIAVPFPPDFFACPMPGQQKGLRFNVEAWEAGEFDQDNLSTLWDEGLSQEEIDAIRNAPKPPSDLDIIGQQLVEKDLQILDLQQQNDILGQQLVSMELRLLQLEGGAGA